MKLISHRGNIDGQDKQRENKIWAIEDCINKGYDVEIDLWIDANILYLGHDGPEIKISEEFLKKYKNKLWIHAKNFNSINYLFFMDLNWFWHETDKVTLTSKGIPWCYPNNWLEKGITVVLNKIQIPNNIYGICTDNINYYKNIL
jgi:hypothetical protein